MCEQNTSPDCLQAIPYSWTLFFVPMHFLTHELLLFATGALQAVAFVSVYGLGVLAWGKFCLLCFVAQSLSTAQIALYAGVWTINIHDNIHGKVRMPS